MRQTDLTGLKEKSVGFTGARFGLTKPRLKELKGVLMKLYTKGYQVLHHGDAIGGDCIAHDLAILIGYKVVVHPPVSPKYRAFRRKSRGVMILPEKEYLDRNRDIVNSSSIMIAMPRDPEKEELRSGTWACVRYARKQGVPIKFV